MERASSLISRHKRWSWQRRRSKWKGRQMPGGAPKAIQAASIRIVPLPQKGSIKGLLGSQPDRASRPAARFSRKGASPLS